jgi:orotate phosphoribosyltransferase
MEAYYEWDGDPIHAHPILRSEMHSTCFFNSRKIIPDERLMGEVASDLVKVAVGEGLDITVIDCVVGPKTGATKLAELMAEVIGSMRGRPCRWASPAKPE